MRVFKVFKTREETRTGHETDPTGWEMQRGAKDDSKCPGLQAAESSQVTKCLQLWHWGTEGVEWVRMEP